MIKLKDTGVWLDEESHTYWLSGKELMGITGMLSRQVFPDMYSGISMSVLNNAAERGRMIHDDLFIHNLTGHISGEHVRRYAGLKKEHNIVVIDNEYHVTDYNYFASAIDQVATINGKLCLIDVKTTSKLHMDYLSYQLSIYRYLFNIVNPELRIEGLYAIWIRDGICRLVPVREIDESIIKDLLFCEENGLQFEAPVSTLPETTQEKANSLVSEMSSIVRQIKELEALKEEYNRQIKNLFNEFGIDSWETDYFKITKVAASKRKAFDKDRFKEDHPDLYEDYISESDVSESIRTKIKDLPDE